MVMPVLVLIGVVLLQVVIFTGTTWSLLAAVGGHATEAAFGMPAVIKRRIRDTTVTFGPIPNGSVTILGRMADEPVTDPRDWRRLGLGKRLAVVMVPWLITFALAIVCLGASRMATSFVHGLYQGLFVLDLTPLVRRLFAITAASPIYVTLGIVFAKVAAVNLLPFPGFTGGGLIMELARIKRVSWIVTGTLVMLFISARVVYALIRVLIG
jgi:membrane-associated protease RseP (regulator of RpoE activity)